MHENGKSMFVPSASMYYSVFKPKRYISYFHEFLLTYFITDTDVSAYCTCPEEQRKLFKKLH